MEKILQCAVNEVYQKRNAFYIMIVFMSLSIILSLGVSPFVLRSLKKTWRFIFVVKVLCAVFYLLTVLLQTYQIHDQGISENQLLDSAKLLQTIWRELSRFVKSYFLYLFEMMCFLNTHDIKTMVCKPFHYSEYSEMSHFIKRVAICFAMCLLFCATRITMIVYCAWNFFKFGGPEYFLVVFPDLLIVNKVCLYVNIVIRVAFKLLYIILMTKMTLLVHKALENSQKVSKKENGSHKALKLFLLVPVVNCLIFILHDFPRFSLPLLQIQNPCSGEKLFKEGTAHILSASTFLVGYLLNCFSYIMLFSPKKCFVCFKQNVG